MFVSNLRHKQHAVGGQCADEDGSSHGAVDQVGPGLQEDGHGDGHSGEEGHQSDECDDGGRLVDWRMADIAGQSCQVGAVKEKTTLDEEVWKNVKKDK